MTRLRTLLRSPLAREGLGVLVSRVLAIALQVANGFLLARGLGAAEYGRYGYALSVLHILLVGVNLGFPTVVMRDVGRALVEGTWDLVKGLRRFTALWMLGTGGLLSLLLVFLAGRLPDPHGRLEALALLSPFLMVASIEMLQMFTLKGLKRIVLASFPFTGTFYALFLLTLFMLQGLTLPRVALGFIGSYLLGILIFQLALGRSFPPAYRSASPRYAIRSWFASALPLFLAGSLFVLNAQVDMVMLGWFRGNEEVGIYRLALRLAGFISFPLFVANASIAPRIVQHHIAGEMDRLARWIRRLIRLAFFGALLIYGGLALLGGWALGLAGETYRQGYGVLLLLGLGQLVNVGAGSVGWILQMTHRERDTAIGVGIALLSNVVLNALLTPRLGYVGTAIATALSLACWNLTLSWFVWRHHRVRVGVI